MLGRGTWDWTGVCSYFFRWGVCGVSKSQARRGWGNKKGGRQAGRPNRQKSEQKVHETPHAHVTSLSCSFLSLFVCACVRLFVRPLPPPHYRPCMMTHTAAPAPTARICASRCRAHPSDSSLFPLPFPKNARLVPPSFGWLQNCSLIYSVRVIIVVVVVVIVSEGKSGRWGWATRGGAGARSRSMPSIGIVAAPRAARPPNNPSSY